MKRLSVGGFLILVALTAGCPRPTDPTPEPESKPFPKVERPEKADVAPLSDVKAVAQGINDFAFDLQRQMPENGNLFLSSFSVSTALSMTYAGAKGDTATEMAKALRYPFEGERLHLGFAGLLGTLSGDGAPAGVQLSVANALWGKQAYLKDFLDLNRNCYAAQLRQIDLLGAEPIINKWAEEQTAGRIKDLLPPNSLTPDSVLVLTNAVYFKGEWKTSFKESETVDLGFRIQQRQAVKVPMMKQTAELRFAHISKGESAPVKILELPYKGGDLAMVIILPDADDGIKAVEKTVTAEKLKTWLDQMTKTEVRVSLPRFQIKGATTPLKDQLQKLGMVKAFSPSADLSGITGGGVWIDTVLHQAFVEVNEKGSEAAAATAVIIRDKDSGDKGKGPIYSTADHPFLFLIRDNRTGCILFQGRLYSPK